MVVIAQGFEFIPRILHARKFRPLHAQKLALRLHKIRRVGENQVRAKVWQGFEVKEAIALQNDIFFHGAPKIFLNPAHPFFAQQGWIIFC